MKTVNVTCTVCPRGCELAVSEENGKITVTGNTCPKGAAYGEAEVVCPVRTITGTVRGKDVLIPVKTNRPVKKSKIFSVMDKIHGASVLTKLEIGDIIIKNIDDDGANLVAASPYSGE